MRAKDLSALSDWAEAATPGLGPFTGAEKFAGGQSNPTFRLTSATGTCVLRRKPPGKLLKSAHAVEREFQVQSALAGSVVPVARMLALCEDPNIIGSAFYLMAEVEGRIFDDPRLPGLEAPDRAALLDEMNRVLAAIHGVDLAAAGLEQYGPRGAYFQRQIDRWTAQYQASATEDLPEMAALIDALNRHGPEDDGRVTLVHGDYRLDNLVFAAEGPACQAVLDWELSTLGHPFADLAAVLMQWRMPPGGAGRGLAGVDRAALGLPSDEDFVASYCERTETTVPDKFGAYVAFSFFRMAAILQGVKKRALDGNASDPERGLKLGAMVPDFAQAGLAALDG